MAVGRSNYATADRYQRVLLELLKQPGNDVCADCKARTPRWASANLGCFLCVQCASIHRKMGVHVSKVKSVTLDSWAKDQVDRMKAGGNLKSNAYYNPDERRNPPPHAAAYIDEGDRNSAMEKFIRQKYERKAFVGQAAPATPAKPPIANRPPQTSAPRASPAPTVASSSSSGHGAAQSIPRPGTAPLPEPRAAPEPVPPVPTDAASYAANRSLPFRAPPSAPILGPSRAVSLPVTAAPSGHSNPFSQSVGPPSYMAAVQPQFQPPQAPAPPPPRTDGVWGDLLQLSPGAVQYTSQLSFMGSSQPQPFAPSYVTQLQAFAGVHQPPGSFGPQPGFASSSFAPTNPFAQPAFQTQQMQMQSQPGVQYGTNPFLTMQTAQQPQQPQQYYAQQPMHGQQPFY